MIAAKEGEERGARGEGKDNAAPAGVEEFY